MRPALLWTLGATGALSAVALWIEDKPVKVVAALESRVAPAELAPRPTTTAPSAAPLRLPERLDPPQIETARRDIFVPVEPPAPKPPPAPPPPPPPPPPAPTAPPVSWRYLGSMVNPAGQRLVMLARGDTSVTIEVGTRLEEGYVVEAIGSDAVRLVYPPLGTVVDIPIPPVSPGSR